MQKTNGLVKRMLALGLAVTTIATSFSTGYAPIRAKAATVEQETKAADNTTSQEQQEGLTVNSSPCRPC